MKSKMLATALASCAAVLGATSAVMAVPPATPDCDAVIDPAAVNEVNFDGCDLSDRDYYAVNFSGSTMQNSTGNVETSFRGTTMTGVNVSGGVYVGSSFDLATLSGLVATGSTFDNVDLNGSNLVGADFTGATVKYSNFWFANLTDADFTDAVINDLRFVSANLTNTDFTNATVGAGVIFGEDPVAVADRVTTPADTPVVLDLLANDTNPNRAPSTTFEAVVVTTPENGTFDPVTMTYTPPAGFNGVATFTYKPVSTLPYTNLPAGAVTSYEGAPATVTISVGTGRDPILNDTYQGMSGTDGRIARLYAAFFNRNPDAAGFAFWQDKIAAGEWTNEQAASFFSSSPEFQSLYGSDLSDEDYIDLIYNNVLGRAGDTGGREFWLGQLAAGQDRGVVMLRFSDSDEFKTVTFTS